MFLLKQEYWRAESMIFMSTGAEDGSQIRGSHGKLHVKVADLSFDRDTAFIVTLALACVW